MSDFNFFFGIIPESSYKYIVMALVALLILRQKIPILNKIDVTIRLPEEFMRNFRWITPLMVAGIYVWIIVVYFALKGILLKVNTNMNDKIDDLQKQVEKLRRGR